VKQSRREASRWWLGPRAFGAASGGTLALRGRGEWCCAVPAAAAAALCRRALRRRRLSRPTQSQPRRLVRQAATSAQMRDTGMPAVQAPGRAARRPSQALVQQRLGRHLVPTAQHRAGPAAQLDHARPRKFFYFYIIFFDLSKIYTEFFFCKNVTSRWFIRRKRDTAGPSGGRYITPVESAVGGRLDGPWWAGNLPPFQPAVAATYRRMSRR